LAKEVPMGWLLPDPVKTVVTKDNDVYNVYNKGGGVSVRRADSGLGRAFGSKVGEGRSMKDALDLIKSDSGSDIKKIR
jgi:hypothetical protein